MYEFRVLVGTEDGAELTYIISAEAEYDAAAEDQVRYLVENKFEVLEITQIKMGG